MQTWTILDFFVMTSLLFRPAFIWHIFCRERNLPKVANFHKPKKFVKWMQVKFTNMTLQRHQVLRRFESKAFWCKGFCFCSYQNLMGQIPISPYLRRPCKLSTTCIGKIAGLGLGFGKLNWRPHPLICVVFLMIHMLDLGGSCEPANLHMKM